MFAFIGAKCCSEQLLTGVESWWDKWQPVRFHFCLCLGLRPCERSTGRPVLGTTVFVFHKRDVIYLRNHSACCCRRCCILNFLAFFFCVCVWSSACVWACFIVFFSSSFHVFVKSLVALLSQPFRLSVSHHIRTVRSDIPVKLYVVTEKKKHVQGEG